MTVVSLNEPAPAAVVPICAKPDCGLGKQAAGLPVHRSTLKPVSSCAVPLCELTRQFTVTLLAVMLERVKLSGAFGVATLGSGIRRVETIRSSNHTAVSTRDPLIAVLYAESWIFPYLPLAPPEPSFTRAASAAFVTNCAGCP